MMENMNAFMRSQELQQLGVEAQRTIRARFETIQKVMKVEEDYRQWQAGGNRFFEKYWKFTDPQKEFSTQEYQVALAALQDRDKDNLPAQLAEALLLTNKGDYSQAKELLDGLVDIEGPIQPVALMCRALALEGMDKDRDSKLSMQNSIKIDRTNPYCRWLRARLACKQDQISIAETEWKALTTVPAMQLDAKRALALLYAQRVSKTPSNAGRAVTLASEAHEKQSPPTWYSHYVLAVSLNTAKKKDEAIKHIESAKELASQEQQEKCDKLKEAIEQDQPFEIKL
jgi:tetratricopeptide (TPR) repeat protein